MIHEDVCVVVTGKGVVLPNTCHAFKQEVEEWCQNNLEDWESQKESGSTIQHFVLVPYDDYCDLVHQFIKGVAVKIKFKEELPEASRSVVWKMERPNRHDDLKHFIAKHLKKKPEEIGECEYGFYTEKHEFLSRKDAQFIALHSGQISLYDRERIIKTGQTELQSPDVW